MARILITALHQTGDPVITHTGLHRPDRPTTDKNRVSAGNIALAEGLTLERTGKFFRWTGEEPAF
ncbi:MAG: hypothetical protein ABJE99_05185 [Roseobacter sp.]